MMAKSPEAFRTISEVAEWLGVQAHVLRFWESKFTQVKPVKRAGGRRYYRPTDMLLLGGVKKLLHDDGMTIKGVQKVLREQGASYVADHSPSLDDLTMAQLDGEIVDTRVAHDAAVLPFESRQVADLPGESATEDAPVAEDREEAEVISVEPDLPSSESDAEPIQNQDAAAAEPEAAEPAPEEAAPKEPDTEEPEVTAAEQEAVESEETVEEPHQPEPEPEPEPESKPDIALPSFMHKPAEEAPAPMAKVPHIVDAPDGPPEDQIEVPAGMLARISTLDRIPASQIDAMRAVQAQLEALHARLSGTGKE